MSKKLGKEELKTPDMFLSTSDRIFAWIEQNLRPIIAVLLVVAVGSLGYVAYGYWNEAKEKKAAAELFKPETELKNAETKMREARAAKMQKLAGLKGNTEEAGTGDFTKDFGPTVAQLREEIKEHSDTKAALISALSLANFLIQQKQFPQALEVLETPKYRPSTNDLLGGFWRMHRGLAFLENKKPDEALKEYQNVIDAKGLSYFHSEALLKTGVAYELKGDMAKARETYERISRDFKGTEASNTAQQYLRLLELKPQQG